MDTVHITVTANSEGDVTVFAGDTIFAIDPAVVAELLAAVADHAEED